MFARLFPMFLPLSIIALVDLRGLGVSAFLEVSDRWI
jgi:hypothetical protein